MNNKHIQPSWIAKGRTTRRNIPTYTPGGDEEACVREFYPILKSLASRCGKRYGTTYEDMLSAGHEVLLRAMRRYDPELGAFHIFATTYLLNEMARTGLRINGRAWLRGKVEKTKKMMEDHRGSSVSYEEVATVHPLLASNIAKMRFSDGTISIDRLSVESEKPLDRFAALGVECVAQTMLENQEIHAAVARLPERSRYFVEAYFYKDQTLEEIGAASRYTRERVRQVLGEALDALGKDKAFAGLREGRVKHGGRLSGRLRGTSKTAMSMLGEGWTTRRNLIKQLLADGKKLPTINRTIGDLMKRGHIEKKESGEIAYRITVKKMKKN